MKPGNAEIRSAKAPLASLIADLAGPSRAAQAEAVLELAARADRATRAALRRALDAPDPGTRWGAAFALWRIGGVVANAALPAMVEALSSGDSDVRWAAAHMLANIGPTRAAPVMRALLRLARSGDAIGRRMALYCMRDLGLADTRIANIAVRALRDAESTVRLAAISLVVRLAAGDDAVEAVMRCLEADPSAGVRRAAALALGRIVDAGSNVFAALERASRSDDLAMRRAAIRAMVLKGAENGR